MQPPRLLLQRALGHRRRLVRVCCRAPRRALGLGREQRLAPQRLAALLAVVDGVLEHL